MHVMIDEKGRIVIPKEIRERYRLVEGSRLELVAYDGIIELVPLVEEGDLAVLSLSEPCGTGDRETHDKAFLLERAWTR